MTKNFNRKAAKPSTSSRPAIPVPFTPVPAHLTTFTSHLNTESVYLTHIDRHPAAFKKQIFAVPVFLNFGILVGLLWRLYYALPWYFSLVATLSQGPKMSEQSFSQSILFTIITRLLLFICDYALATIVAPWPYTFFLESPGNPVSWRLKSGFRANEVVVRVSRNWGSEDLLGGTNRGGDSPFFKTRLIPALMPDKMQKTGYLLMDKDWDLDFGLMTTTTTLIDKKELKESQLDRIVFAWYGAAEKGQWIVWDEKAYHEQAVEEVVELEESSNTEHRDKIFQIQSKMQEMGKEDLFFKWVELIQYESTRPGGFTKERQLEAGAKVQALFEEHGVDLDEFEKSVGGLQ